MTKKNEIKRKLTLEKKARTTPEAEAPVETVELKPAAAELAAEAQALEKQIQQTRTEVKKGFALGSTTLMVLDQASHILRKRSSDALPDPVGRARNQFHTKLLDGCDGNVVHAVNALMKAPTPYDLTSFDRRPARVFSFLFDVMKTCMFITNGRYRLWLAGTDVPLYEARNTVRGAPYGLEFKPDAMVDGELMHAIEELQAWFTSMVTAVGFKVNDQPIENFPLCYELQPDQSLKPITDVIQAWDVVQKRAEENRLRRLANEAKARDEALAIALKEMEGYRSKSAMEQPVTA